MKIISKKNLVIAVDALKNSELVVIPTETVYGLAANAFSYEAVEKIYHVKKRPTDNPLIVHISDTKMLDSVAAQVPPIAYQLFATFSPGPLTLILKKGNLVASNVTNGLDTVAVRIPKHKLTLELLKRLNFPLAAPSANLSGYVSPTKLAHVVDDLDTLVPFVIDGGDSVLGIESTVLDLTSEFPTILRPGVITKTDLLKVIPIVVENSVNTVIKSPGTKYKHYAPRITAIGIENYQEAKKIYQENINLNPVIIGSSNFIYNLSELNSIDLGANVNNITKNYYAALRKADQNFGFIILETFKGEEYASLMNRIRKTIGEI